MADVNPHGTIFVGPALSNSDLDLIVKSGSKPAIEVEMALFTEKNGHGLNDVLLRITGAAAAAAGIDGKTLRYHTVPSGTGTDFRYFKGGEERARLTTRDTWSGWTTVQLHVDGKPYDLRAHPRGAADARPLHLLTAYTEANGEAPSRLQLERQVAAVSEQMGVKLSLDWSGFDGDMRARRAIALAWAALPAAWEQLTADEFGKEALAPIKSVKVSLQANGGIVARKDGAGLNLLVGLPAGDDQSAHDERARTDWIVRTLEAVL